MLELALNYDRGQNPVSAKEIAVCQQISVKYLEQLLAALRPRGLGPAWRRQIVRKE
jgi:DNA-binding IscR family transcriptional regulator